MLPTTNHIEPLLFIAEKMYVSANSSLIFLFFAGLTRKSLKILIPTALILFLKKII